MSADATAPNSLVESYCLWRNITACVFLMMVSSTTYMFSSYSVALGDELDLTSTDLNLIAACGNVGTWAGAVSGLLVDRYGPRMTALCGGVLALLGYTAFAGAVQGIVPSTPLALALYAIFWSQGNNWTYFAGLKHLMLTVHSCDSALFMGQLVCLYSLIAGVFAQLYRGLFMSGGRDGLTYFFLFVGSTSFIVASFSSIQLVNPEPIFGEAPHPLPAKQRTMVRMSVCYTILLIVVVAISAAVSIAAAHTSGSFVLAIILVVMCALYLLIPTLARKMTSDSTSSAVASFQPISEVEQDSSISQTDAQVRIVPASPLRHPDVHLTIRQALVMGEYYAVLGVLMFGVGSGVVLLNNVGVIIASQLPDTEQGHTYRPHDLALKEDSATGVMIFSVTNALGRLMFGFVSDRLERVHRWYYLIVALALLVAGHLVSLAYSVAATFSALALCGLGYGGVFCIAPTLLRDLFGTRNFGIIWGFMGFSPAIPSFAFGAFLAGRLSDHVAQDSYYFVESRRYCLGTACYRWTLLTNVVVAGCGLVCTLWLTMRLNHKLKLQKEKNDLN
eukprot:PhM_4_TR4469/c0_g1_i1/m.1762